MTSSLTKLMEIAGRVEMTPVQREQQRRSFAYGSANIENERVTRQMVDAAAEKLKSTKKSSDG